MRNDIHTIHSWRCVPIRFRYSWRALSRLHRRSVGRSDFPWNHVLHSQPSTPSARPGRILLPRMNAFRSRRRQLTKPFVIGCKGTYVEAINNEVNRWQFCIQPGCEISLSNILFESWMTANEVIRSDLVTQPVWSPFSTYLWPPPYDCRATAARTDRWEGG